MVLSVILAGGALAAVLTPADRLRNIGGRVGSALDSGLTLFSGISAAHSRAVEQFGTLAAPSPDGRAHPDRARWECSRRPHMPTRTCPSAGEPAQPHPATRSASPQLHHPWRSGHDRSCPGTLAMLPTRRRRPASGWPCTDHRRCVVTAQADGQSHGTAIHLRAPNQAPRRSITTDTARARKPKARTSPEQIIRVIRRAV
jgi:hypothetical protein